MDHGMRGEGMRGGWDGGFGGMEHGLSGGFGWWFGICLTLMAISLIVLTVYAVMAWHRGRGGSPAGGEASGSDAKAVLDQRLATGEIGPDDYTRRLDTLRGS